MHVAHFQYPWSILLLLQVCAPVPRGTSSTTHVNVESKRVLFFNALQFPDPIPRIAHRLQYHSSLYVCGVIALLFFCLLCIAAVHGNVGLTHICMSRWHNNDRAAGVQHSVPEVHMGTRSLHRQYKHTHGKHKIDGSLHGLMLLSGQAIHVTRVVTCALIK